MFARSFLFPWMYCVGDADRRAGDRERHLPLGAHQQAGPELACLQGHAERLGPEPQVRGRAPEMQPLGQEAK